LGGDDQPLQECDDKGHAIAVIGGGFSGAMVLWHLIENASQPLAVYWYDSAPELAAGVAYGCAEAPHLLNVRADKMGALPEKVDGFYEWLLGQGEGEPLATSFQPRQRYATYLQSLLKEALTRATQKNIRVHHQVKHVGSLVELPSVSALVLAMGTPPSRRFTIPNHIRYIADSWRDSWPEDLAAWPATSEIGIIGTALTAVDAILSLQYRGYQGKVIAFSRHGWLPAEHRAFEPLPVWSDLLENPASRSALGLLRIIKKRVKEVQDWRAVIDSLRPIIPALWQNLSVKEQQKFLRKLFSLWNVHRHRMAPEIGETLRRLQSEGRLEIKAMHVEDFLALHQPDLLINCTGPDFDITRQPSPLLKEMLEAGMVEPDALRLGLALDAEGRAVGKAS
jgi:uncharacterized NAD(P)/FAD-binding protein YdhS